MNYNIIFGIVLVMVYESVRLASCDSSNQISSYSDDDHNATLNLAWDYDANYHIAFALIGFTTIFIAVTVFGLAVSIWNIDPGRDTIIFRMTSQRKKDQ